MCLSGTLLRQCIRNVRADAPDGFSRIHADISRSVCRKIQNSIICAFACFSGGAMSQTRGYASCRAIQYGAIKSSVSLKLLRIALPQPEESFGKRFPDGAAIDVFGAAAENVLIMVTLCFQGGGHP